MVRHVAGREVDWTDLSALNDGRRLHAAADRQGFVAGDRAAAAAILAHRIFPRSAHREHAASKLFDESNENHKFFAADSRARQIGRNHLLL